MEKSINCAPLISAARATGTFMPLWRVCVKWGPRTETKITHSLTPLVSPCRVIININFSLFGCDFLMPYAFSHGSPLQNYALLAKYNFSFDLHLYPWQVRVSCAFSSKIVC